jgi:AcrR family transcriptional regulator
MARKPALEGVDRRQLILEAALDVFAEQGFEGATTKEIAARAGVTHGLIYFYFASKEELFQAAFQLTLSGVAKELPLSGAAESSDEPAVVIERCVTLLLETLSSPRVTSLARIMMRMAANNDQRAGPLRECKQIMKRAVGSLADAFAAYLDAQIAAGRLRPVDSRAAVSLLIGGAVATFRGSGLCPEESEESRRARAHEWARAYCDILLLGMVPRANVQEAATAAGVSAILDT